MGCDRTKRSLLNDSALEKIQHVKEQSGIFRRLRIKINEPSTLSCIQKSLSFSKRDISAFEVNKNLCRVYALVALETDK